jgi:uncharacterized 2Fe-2S/4Fe-4S cluster protein (DUF4445 family)
MLSEEEFKQGIRQACQTTVLTDLIVSIPLKSKLDKAVQSRERKMSAGVSASGWKFSPPLNKYYLELPQPTLVDNVSDLSRVMRGLKQKYNFSDLTLDFDVIRNLAEVLRTGNWKITVTTLVEAAKPENNTRPQPRIVHIESGILAQPSMPFKRDVWYDYGVRPASDPQPGHCTG